MLTAMLVQFCAIPALAEDVPPAPVESELQNEVDAPADAVETEVLSEAEATVPATDAPSTLPAVVEEAPASTIDVLDEDNRLDESGEAPKSVEAGDLATGEPAPSTGQPDDSGSTDVLGYVPTPETAASEPSEADAVPPKEGLARTETSDAELFPTSPGIELQKQFWIEIFTHYHSQQGVLHDGRIALPVYESLDLTGMSYRNQRRYIRQRKAVLSSELRDLAETIESGAALNSDHRALLERLPEGSTPQDMREFARNVRFQRGLADRFRRGLERSGALMDHMRRILAKHDVPEDLMYLPHVESSFNNATHSSAGAAGIWQFTRGTGRMFMTLRYELDERLDPIIATESAAKFLRQNYEKLGTWPLAITAYNHGPQSLERIVKRMGTRDLGVLIQEYDGRLFKFASKNFYAEFLAAREVARDAERYFSEIEYEPTLSYTEVNVPWYLDVEQAAQLADLSVAELRKLNPALRHTVWSGSKYIPPGYALRVPPTITAGEFLAAVPEEDRHDKQKRSLYVRVARGDTLYDIGRRHGISWRTIALANNIRSARHLRPGMKLMLPWDGVNPPTVAAAPGASEGTANGSADGSADGAARRVFTEQVVERVPFQPSGPWNGGEPGDGSADVIADEFQDLRVVRYDEKRRIAQIVAAYGETVGAYANWAGVTAQELRRINDMSWRNVLRPGETYIVPLDAVTSEQFEQRRMEFHRQREQAFFAEYSITEKVKIAARRGQSPWNLAQAHNVPMWLFYKENPQLLTQPLRVGMEVILPVVQAGSVVTQ